MPRGTTSIVVALTSVVVARLGQRKSVRVSTCPAKAWCSRRVARQTASPSGTSAGRGVVGWGVAGLGVADAEGGVHQAGQDVLDRIAQHGVGQVVVGVSCALTITTRAEWPNA